MTGRRGPEPVGERLRRLLVMLPWLMERGDTPVAEVADRFGITEAQVVKDIELASCCGLPPYVEEMLDVIVDDGTVWVGPPRIFTRPLRLTAKEGLSLLAAVRAALALRGAEPEGALARAAAKLAAVVGGGVVVDVERPRHLDGVERAVGEGRLLRVRYYSASRNEVTDRVIAPHAVFLDRGNWYVVADDRASGAERSFRVDRIETCEIGEETFERRAVTLPTDDGWFSSSEGQVVTLRLPAAAAWVAETYPIIEVRPSGEDLLVTLAVVSERWLARLLLRVGPRAEVIDPPELRGVASRTARTVLARYG